MTTIDNRHGVRVITSNRGADIQLVELNLLVNEDATWPDDPAKRDELITEVCQAIEEFREHLNDLLDRHQSSQ